MVLFCCRNKGNLLKSYCKNEGIFMGLTLGSIILRVLRGRTFSELSDPLTQPDLDRHEFAPIGTCGRRQDFVSQHITR